MNYFISYTCNFDGRRLGNIIFKSPYEITVENFREVENYVEEVVKEDNGITENINLVILNFIRIE